MVNRTKKMYKIFAGKKTGKGSKDKDGFSHNGEFFHYISVSKEGAISQFRKEYKNYNIYNISR